MRKRKEVQEEEEAEGKGGVYGWGCCHCKTANWCEPEIIERA
jgi:hypothetical protein